MFVRLSDRLLLFSPFVPSHAQPFMHFMKFFEKKKPVAPSRKCPECKEAVALDGM